MERACAFTGHRDIPAGDFKRLRERLYAVITDLYNEGVTVFYTGGAVGFDMLAAEAVVYMRQTLPIRLVVAVPFPAQPEKYGEVDKARYANILYLADSRVTVCPEYRRDAYFVRNRYMVDRAEVCVAYLTHTGGGTAYTASYAEECGKRMIYIQ